MLVLCAALLLPAAADGAGLPVPSGHSSRIGATAPGSDARLVARRAGHDTVVTALPRGTTRRLTGRWDVPAVTVDSATTGLSADGGTLVLVHRTKTFPSSRTRLLVLDAHHLSVRRHITLRGFFTVDAISPDGTRAYVIQYPADLSDYRVRVLDTRTGRLGADDIVDPREPTEKLTGVPFSRVVSPDGRWAYTLYGGGDETFIHALDTVGATAACIDIDALSPNGDFSQARLVLRGGRLLVRDHGSRVATVNTTTFAVREPEPDAAPVATARPAAAPAPPPAPEPRFPWIVVVPILAGVAALAAVALRPRATPSARTFESRRP